MRPWTRLRQWLRSLWRPGSSDARVAEEFAFHLEMERRKLVRQGMSPAEARRRARVAFGGVERYRDEMREGRPGRWLLDLSGDLRHAARRLRRRPAFALTVGLTLAVALGALGAAYSVAYGVLIRPLPFPDGHRLVMVWQTLPGWQRFPASYPIYDRWAAEAGSFRGLAAYGRSEGVITGGAAPERVALSETTANLADVLGIRPARGRWFSESEDRAGAPVVVVSHDYWRTRLGADPEVVGSTLLLDDRPRTVVGVMPAEVRFPSDRTALWTPLGPDARERGWNSQSLSVVGRLAPGVTVEAAASEVAAVTERAVAGGESPEVGSRVVPRRDDVLGGVRRTLVLALAAAGAVLLIGLLNVTNLFLARGVAARGELALRRALGAGRIRLGRELVVEGVLLSVVAALGGLLLVGAAVASVDAWMPAPIPRLSEVAVDAPVVAVVVGVAAMAGALLGLVAATAAMGGDGRLSTAGDRQTDGRRTLGFRAVMVALQVAGVFALLSGAGLLLQSLDRLMAEERGFDAPRLVALVEPRPLETRYPDAAAREGLFRRTAERLSAVPGVEGVALVAPMPFSGSERTTGVPLDDARSVTVGATEVTAGALEVLGVRIVRGRGFVPEDEGASASPVVVVGESLARRLRADGRVVGLTIPLGDAGGTARIVGVAADVRQEGLDEPPLPRIWRPWSGTPGEDVSVVAAVTGDPSSLLPPVRAALEEVEVTLAAERLAPVAELVRESAVFPRLRALVVLVLAVAAGAMASVGVYGVTSYAVLRRKRELSIRSALGARPGRVVRDALGRELRIIAVGVVAGLPAALLLGRTLRGFLHDVAPGDPATHAVTAVAIFALAAAAVAVPVVRAVRTDAARALRED